MFFNRKNALLASAARGALSAGASFARPRMEANNSEIKKISDDLRKIVNDFQASNDERLKQLEGRGEDPITAEQVEKMNASITETKSSLDDLVTKVQAVETAQARPVLGGGETDERKVRQTVARFFSAKAGKYISPLEVTDDQVEQVSNYNDAFNSLLRVQGNVNSVSADIRNALSVGSDPDGGYLVPPETTMEMATRIFDTSEMRQVAGQITVGTDRFSMPKDVNDATSGGWVGEQQARTATATPEIGEQHIDVHEQYAYPEITQKLIDDAVIDVEAWLTNKTVRKMVRTENTGFVSGNGVSKPKGFLFYKDDAVTTDDASRDWGKLQYVASGAAGGFPSVSGSTASDPDALIDLIRTLHPDYRANARFAMNRSSEAEIRKLKDADGRYLVGMGTLDEQLAFNLFGYPISNFEDMPDITSDSFSLAFGDWTTGYLIVDRIGVRVLRDPFTNKPRVGLYVTKRVGGDVVNFDAIKLMKFATS